MLEFTQYRHLTDESAKLKLQEGVMVQNNFYRSLSKLLAKIQIKENLHKCINTPYFIKSLYNNSQVNEKVEELHKKYFLDLTECYSDGTLLWFRGPEEIIRDYSMRVKDPSLKRKFIEEAQMLIPEEFYLMKEELKKHGKSYYDTFYISPRK